MKKSILHRVLVSLSVFAFVAVITTETFGAPRVIVESVLPFPSGESFAPDDPDNRLPQLVGAIDVAYPPELLANPVGDRVWVAFIVDSTGKPRKVRAFFGQHSALEQAAVAAVERATFLAGRHVGRNVSTQMTVLVRFEVDS